MISMYDLFINHTEAEYANFLDKPIIPLKFDDCKPTGLMARLFYAHEPYDVKTEESFMENLPKVQKVLEDAKKKHPTLAGM